MIKEQCSVIDEIEKGVVRWFGQLEIRYKERLTKQIYESIVNEQPVEVNPNQLITTRSKTFQGKSYRRSCHNGITQQAWVFLTDHRAAMYGPVSSKHILIHHIVQVFLYLAFLPNALRINKFH